MIGPSSTHAALAKRQRRQERRDQFDCPTAMENVGETIFSSVCGVALGALMTLGATFIGCEAIEAWSR